MVMSRFATCISEEVWRGRKNSVRRHGRGEQNASTSSFLVELFPLERAPPVFCWRPWRDAVPLRSRHPASAREAEAMTRRKNKKTERRKGMHALGATDAMWRDRANRSAVRVWTGQAALFLSGRSALRALNLGKCVYK